jgi:S1-C subfamily serine protease
MTVLSELSDAARLVIERAGPSTVAIGRNGRGSGVVLADGQVLTNAHNLRDRTTQITFADGRSAQGSVAGVDTDGDLAVLTVDTAGTPAITWAETEAAAGDVVFALAGSSSGSRISFGLVSGSGRAFRGPRGRRIHGSLEHTAPLARGASGGPVVDAEGRLVAVNTHRLDGGTYLAVPATSELKARVERLAAGESTRRRTLGVAVAPAAVAARLRRSVGLPEREGLLVRGVDEGSPADRAGIRQGDLLVAAGGAPLARADDLFVALDTLTGDELSIDFVRGTEELTVMVRFDGAPTPDAGGDEPAPDSDAA